MPTRRMFLAGGLAAAGLSGAAFGQEASRLLAPLREGGRVLILRHAQTEPGVGDPAGYRLDDCSGQRNLNDLGKRQSRRLGEALAEAGIELTRALSSRWCRCVDTARIA
ncbi:MAG: histidine phosphatase family protein, partial [Pseudomonadota bacterium]